MVVQCSRFIFLTILNLLPMCCSVTEPTLKMGPFKTSIVSAKVCSNTGRPYAKNPFLIFEHSVQNVNGKNTFGGNLTVLRDTKDVKIKLKSFLWRNGKWQLSHSFNNLNCHGALLHFTCLATNIKYDKKNCMFLKGFYSFKNLDVNRVQHIWVAAMPYGRLLWRAETYSNDGLLDCQEFDTLTEPADFV